MSGWIFSTEPDVFPWSKVEALGRARWDGIRGPLARKNLRSLRTGDVIFGYHSSPEKRVVCLARAAGEACPDPADPAWLAVDVVFDRWLERPVTLAALRAEKAFSMMPFLRIPRLSIAPLKAAQVRKMLSLSQEIPHVKCR